MNKKLIKDLSRELEIVKQNSIPLAEHLRELEKLKRDKANIIEVLSIANKALDKACEELRKAQPCSSDEKCGKSCTRCNARKFRCEVENEE